MDDTARVVPPDHRIGKRFGDYLVEAQIGRGGMGVVFRARHEVSGDVVALKLMAPDLAHNETFRERFIAEAEATPNLSHPNIVPVFESGEADGELFIAMELIEGTDLKGLIKQEGRLDPKRVLAIFRQAGGALDAAHEAGMVHRDVKPQNILIIPRESPTDADRVYLTDFGLVRPLTSETTASRTGQVFGSVAYMAPELIEGIPADGRADVYALGCVLYECLTGLVPFERENEVSTVWAHIHEDPPLLTDTCRDLPGGLNDVVFKAMSKHPDDRFLTCGEFVNELELGLGRKLSAIKYAHVRPLVARVPRRKTEREVWAPNFFPELSRVRAASRERFDWRKTAALVAAVLALSTVQVGREGGLPQAAADVADAAGSVAPAIVRVLNSEEDQDPLTGADPDPGRERPFDSTRSSETKLSTDEQTRRGPTNPRRAGVPAPSEAGNDDLIAFSSNADGDYDIYVIRPDGTGLEKLTYNEVDDWDAAWSPNGEQLVFVRGGISGTNQENDTDLFIMRWDGSDVRRLTDDEDRETAPSWSKDGKIVFQRWDENGDRIFVINDDGSKDTLVQDSGLEPDWSPDGASIVYSGGDPARLFTMRGDGSSGASLTGGDATVSHSEPEWSPDGRMIAFTHGTGVGLTDVEVAVTDMSGDVTKLVAGDDPDWSPDARWLVYTAGALKVMKPDGSESRTLLNIGGPAVQLMSPAWRPQTSGK